MAGAPRILIVDDDPRIAQTLEAYFRRDGFAVTTAGDGDAALAQAGTAAPDIVVLDLALPDADGLDVCDRLRAADAELPIVMITARTTLDDRLTGLDRGADDYITKPFSPREVVARVRAVLRRAKRPPGELTFGPLTVARERHSAAVEGRELDLTPTEFRILAALTGAPNITLSRAALIERALGFDYEGRERTIDTHVTNLRRKLGVAGAAVVTVFGVGYRFEPPS